MAGSKNTVRYGAESLRIALVAKLQANRNDVAARGRIFSAIQLCDKFLASPAQSPAALEALKQEVQKALSQESYSTAATRPPTQAAGKKSSGRLATQQTAADKAESHVQTPGGAATPGLARTASKGSDEYFMPNHLLQAKAFVRGGDYDKMILKQDSIARKDMDLEKEQRKEAIKAVKKILDEQMKYVDKKRKEERKQKVSEAEDMKQSIAQFQKEEQEMSKQQQEKALATRRLYAEQAEERRKELERQREVEQRWIEEERAKLKEIQDKEAADKAAQRAENQRKMLAFKEEQEVAIQEKKKQKAAQLEEEREYSKQYMQMLENWEVTRERQAAERAEKSRLKMLAGGAEALQKGREELERMDEERANRLQAEHEAKMLEQARQQRLKQQQETQKRLETLAKQMAEKAAAEEARKQEALMLRHEVALAAKEAKQRESEEKLRQKEEKQKALQEQRNAIKEASRRRFNDYVGVMVDSEKKMQAAIMEGTRRGVQTVYGKVHAS